MKKHDRVKNWNKNQYKKESKNHAVSATKFIE